MALLDFSTPHLIRDEAEYEQAVVEIDALLDRDPSPYTEDYERLEFLSVLVEEYESKHVPFEAASPQELVDFMLEQKGLTRADLADVMGGRSRVSDFFSGKRDLSKNQAIALRELLGIALDGLLR